MPTGPEVSNGLYRNQRMAVQGLATEIGTATASSGAATVNDLVFQVTSEALSTAAAAEYTLTVTNSKVAAGDIVLASVDANGSAGTPAICGCSVSANTVVITVSNVHASAAFDGAIKINGFVIKAL